MALTSRASAIVWAQWRALRNMGPRSGAVAKWFPAAAGTVWYGGWTVVAATVCSTIVETGELGRLQMLMGAGLLLAFLYWQVIPLMMVSGGAALDMRRLRVYPIPETELFWMETLLRLTMAVEMVIVLLGAALGVVLHPGLGPARAVPVLLFALFNLFLSTGVREVLSRLLQRRRLRELGVLVILAVTALPQLLLRRADLSVWRDLTGYLPDFPWPWTAAAALSVGPWHWAYAATLLGWVGLAFVFARWQFTRGLRFDEEAARAAGERQGTDGASLDRLYRLPSLLFPDPLAALIEKEIRCMARSPRFRISFLMGCSFGVLVWLPATFGDSGGARWARENVLAMLFAYALMLLADVSIWNVLGPDRRAAQTYWAAPLTFRHVLVAKNVAAICYAWLEMALITLVCLSLRLPLRASAIAEAMGVSMILLLGMLSVGNLSSVYGPRAVDPNQTWKRGSSGAFQAQLLVLYPALLGPFALAYWLRWTWGDDRVFHAAVGVLACIASGAYVLTLRRATRVAKERREQIMAVLAGGDGPVAA